MSLIHIIWHIVIPTLLGALAVWVGVTRIPWRPDDKD